TTNLLVQGTGFLFTQTNSSLVISNDVETTVQKGLLRSSLLTPNPEAAKSSGTLKIFADRCQYNYFSNVVDYIGHVRVQDPEMTMTSAVLSIQFTTNSEI